MQLGPAGPFFRAPTEAWRKLNVPAGALVLGRSSGTGNLQFVPQEMLTMHTLVAGATGSGKSMWLCGSFMQHVLMLDGVLRGGTLIDPHGSLTKLIEEHVVAHDLHKVRKIRILRPGQGDVVGFDLLPEVEGVDPAVIVDAVVSAVATVWHQNLDEMPRLRQALSAVLYAIKVCKLTLLEAIDLMLVEDRSGLRRYVTDRIKHPVFKAYFEDLEALPVAKRKEELESTGRRLSEFLKLDIIRLCFGVRSKEKLINFGQVMDKGEILVLDLSTGPHLSLAGSKLLGSLVVNSLFLHCLKRKEGATPHHLYIDEAGQYLTEDAASILDQARKFGLHFTLCVQTLAQIRERGEKLFGSVMANTRTKVIFGGLDDDEATTLARTCWRGQFNLERSKRSFERMVVTGDELVWLGNEATSAGISRSQGRTWSSGQSVAEAQSTTDSSSTTQSASRTQNETVTRSESETRGRSRTRSQTEGYNQGTTLTLGETESASRTHSDSLTENSSRTRSESTTESSSTTHSHSETVSDTETEDESWSSSESVADASHESEGESTGTSESYDYEYPTLDPLQLPYGQHTAATDGTSSSSGRSHAETSSSTEGSSRSRSHGTATSDGYADTVGVAYQHGTAETTGEARSQGVADTRGRSRSRSQAESEGRSLSLGEALGESVAHQRGLSRAHGTAKTVGTAKTLGRSTSVGTTATRSQGQGGSLTHGVSESHTSGRGQAFRAIYEKRPTKEYSLQELIHLASVSIANLPIGTCLCKIGSRRVVRINALRVRRRVVSEEHLSRVRGEMFRDTPFALTRDESGTDKVCH
jgi:hypothetical protein